MTTGRTLSISRLGIRLGEQDVSMYGSEFFYFRHDPSDWPAIIEQLRNANCNAVTLPIPWNWHDLGNGRYDFDGTTHPRRNVRAVLDLLAHQEMYVIARPGPYICAEWDNGGIPEDLLAAHPEILSLDAAGKTLPKIMDAYPVITCLHPTYLEHVATWYDAVGPILRAAQWTAGGPIVSVEIDGEPSYWMTIPQPLSSDYNPAVTDGDGFYESWLRARYGSIRALNQAYRARYRSFAEVPAPRALPRSPRDYPRFIDWHVFKLDMVNEYVERLYNLLRKRGIEVPLSVLDPYLDFDLEGWESFRRYFQNKEIDILPTTEIYPSGIWEAIRTSHIKEDAVQYVAGKLAIYRSLADRMDAPRICVEAQAAATLRLDRDEADLLYHMLLAYGLDHLIYWTMPSGTNPPGRARSFTGTVHDKSNAVGMDGKPRPHYEVIKRLGRFLRTQPLTGFDVRTDVAIGFYEPYRALSYVGNTLESGLDDDIQDTLRQSFFPSNYGLVSLLALSGVTFDAVMLETASVDELLTHPQLWIFTLEILDVTTQERLLRYVERGGKLVMLPRIPTLDLAGRSCTILADAIGVKPRARVTGTIFDWFRTPRQFVRYDGSPDEVLVFDYLQTFDLPSDADPIVWSSSSGEACGFSRRRGEGQFIVLGFKPSYTADGLAADRGLVWRLLEHAQIERVARAETEDVLVIQRSRGQSAYLFVINAGGWPTQTRIEFSDPTTGTRRWIPRLLDGVELSGRGGLILPLNLEISGTDDVVEYATSEVLEASGDERQILLRMFGHPNTRGEIVVRSAGSLGEAAIDGIQLTGGARRWDSATRSLTLTYGHPGYEFTLTIERETIGG